MHDHDYIPLLVFYRTENFGGLRLCADSRAVVFGGDGRWHRKEECDDGNLNDGDGCSQASAILDDLTLDEIKYLTI